jgi:hypothetical protein
MKLCFQGILVFALPYLDSLVKSTASKSCIEKLSLNKEANEGEE